MTLPGDPISTTDVILRHIESLGYRVSVFHLQESMLGLRPAAVEIQAVGEDGHTHIASVEGEGAWTEYTAACCLAESVGVDLEDG